MNPSSRELIVQGGSKYTAHVRGKLVTQGNELEISPSQAPRDYVQEGSNFGGNIDAEGSVLQGNKIRVWLIVTVLQVTAGFC